MLNFPLIFAAVSNIVNICSLQADIFKALRCSPLNNLDLRWTQLEFIDKGKNSNDLKEILRHDNCFKSNLLRS